MQITNALNIILFMVKEIQSGVLGCERENCSAQFNIYSQEARSALGQIALEHEMHDWEHVRLIKTGNGRRSVLGKLFFVPSVALFNLVDRKWARENNVSSVHNIPVCSIVLDKIGGSEILEENVKGIIQSVYALEKWKKKLSRSVAPDAAV